MARRNRSGLLRTAGESMTVGKGRCVLLLCVLISIIGGAPRSPQFVPTEAVDTKGFFSPKIDLRDIRFVFCNDGRLFTELQSEYGDVLDDLLRRGTISIRGHGNMLSDVNESDQKVICRSIHEHLGGQYTLLFPDSFTSSRSTLTGVTLFPSGDGFRGFLGVLGNEGACPKCYGVGGCFGRVHALALKGSMKVRTLPMPGRTIPQNDRQEIERKAIEAMNGKDVSLWEARDLYCRYPDIRGAIAILRDPCTGWKYLLPFVQRKRGWDAFPIQSHTAEGADGGSVVFLHTKVASCSFMHSSEFCVLPDLDGNGANEVLIVSDIISVLFSIELDNSGENSTQEDPGEYRLREIRGVSFSP